MAEPINYNALVGMLNNFMPADATAGVPNAESLHPAVRAQMMADRTGARAHALSTLLGSMTTTGQQGIEAEHYRNLAQQAAAANELAQQKAAYEQSLPALQRAMALAGYQAGKPIYEINRDVQGLGDLGIFQQPTNNQGSLSISPSTPMGAAIGSGPMTTAPQSSRVQTPEEALAQLAIRNRAAQVALDLTAQPRTPGAKPLAQGTESFLSGLYSQLPASDVNAFIGEHPEELTQFMLSKYGSDAEKYLGRTAYPTALGRIASWLPGQPSPAETGASNLLNALAQKGTGKFTLYGPRRLFGVAAPFSGGLLQQNLGQ